MNLYNVGLYKGRKSEVERLMYTTGRQSQYKILRLV